MSLFTNRSLNVPITYSAGDNLIIDGIFSSGVTRTESTTPVRKLRILIKRDGVYRIKFSIMTYINYIHAYGRIYKNGVAYGTLQSVDRPIHTPVEFSEDLAFSANDYCDFYIWAAGSYNLCTIRYCKLSISSNLGLPTVTMDVGL